jgi:Na+/H+-translocating membrane pyrophosphatase
VVLVKRILFSLLIFSLLFGCAGGQESSSQDDLWSLKSSNKRFYIINTDFVAGKQDKHMWVFNKHISQFQDKKLRVIATHKDRGEETTVIEGLSMTITSAMKPQVTRIPSSFTLPSKGIWRLDVYVDDEHYGHLVVEAK